MIAFIAAAVLALFATLQAVLWRGHAIRLERELHDIRCRRSLATTKGNRTKALRRQAAEEQPLLID